MQTPDTRQQLPDLNKLNSMREVATDEVMQDAQNRIRKAMGGGTDTNIFHNPYRFRGVEIETISCTAPNDLEVNIRVVVVVLTRDTDGEEIWSTWIESDDGGKTLPSTCVPGISINRESVLEKVELELGKLKYTINQ